MTRDKNVTLTGNTHPLHVYNSYIHFMESLVSNLFGTLCKQTERQTERQTTRPVALCPCSTVWAPLNESGRRASDTDQFGCVVAEDRWACRRPRQRQRWRHVHDTILLSSPTHPPSSPISQYTLCTHQYTAMMRVWRLSVCRVHRA